MIGSTKPAAFGKRITGLRKLRVWTRSASERDDGSQSEG